MLEAFAFGQFCFLCMSYVHSICLLRRLFGVYRDVQYVLTVEWPLRSSFRECNICPLCARKAQWKADRESLMSERDFYPQSRPMCCRDLLPSVWLYSREPCLELSPWTHNLSLSPFGLSSEKSSFVVVSRSTPCSFPEVNRSREWWNGVLLVAT